MENENTNLVVKEEGVMQGLFVSPTDKKVVSNIDISDDEQSDMLLNALTDVDYKLNDCIDKVIECVGFYTTERAVDSFNDENGEVITRKKHTLMLFDKDGKSYVTGSNACFMSFDLIVSLKGQPTPERPLKLIPIKVDAKEKGHSYLKLKLSK